MQLTKSSVLDSEEPKLDSSNAENRVESGTGNGTPSPSRVEGVPEASDEETGEEDGADNQNLTDEKKSAGCRQGSPLWLPFLLGATDVLYRVARFAV